MKKRTYLQWLYVGIAALVTTVPAVSRATTISMNPFGDPKYGNLSDTGLGDTDPVVVSAQIINVFLRLLGTVTVILMIYAGWIWLWARGNEEDIKRAKDIMRGAIIGLLVVLASFGIMQFVFYYLAKITNAVQ